MIPYLVIAGTVCILLIASVSLILLARWLGRQTQRDENLRLTRWLAHLALDAELLFETDNEARIARYARTDRPLRSRAAILQHARDGTPVLPVNHSLACLDHRSVQAELNGLFEP